MLKSNQKVFKQSISLGVCTLKQLDSCTFFLFLVFGYFKHYYIILLHKIQDFALFNYFYFFLYEVFVVVEEINMTCLAWLHIALNNSTQQ